MTESNAPPVEKPVPIPEYLSHYYLWAYVSRRAIRFWDHGILVQLILFGQYSRLKNRVRALFSRQPGSVLQIACVYGSLTSELVADLHSSETLTLVDVVPDQLARSLGKIDDQRLKAVLANSADLPCPSGQFDKVLLFFLLHEQPLQVRIRTVQEALRVLGKNGLLVIVDYDRPCIGHPCYLILSLIFAWLEPFARDLWRQDLSTWIRSFAPGTDIKRTSVFGGVYQILEIRNRS